MKQILVACLIVGLSSGVAEANEEATCKPGEAASYIEWQADGKLTIKCAAATSSCSEECQWQESCGAQYSYVRGCATVVDQVTQANKPSFLCCKVPIDAPADCNAPFTNVTPTADPNMGNGNQQPTVYVKEAKYVNNQLLVKLCPLAERKRCQLSVIVSVIVTEPPTTDTPTPTPTEASTAAPTEASTAAPTEASTAAPTEASTAAPTEASTAAPTEASTAAPTEASTRPTIYYSCHYTSQNFCCGIAFAAYDFSGTAQDCQAKCEADGFIYHTNSEGCAGYGDPNSNPANGACCTM